MNANITDKINFIKNVIYHHITEFNPKCAMPRGHMILKFFLILKKSDRGLIVPAIFQMATGLKIHFSFQAGISNHQKQHLEVLFLPDHLWRCKVLELK